MTMPRSQMIDPSRSVTVHSWSKCVRDAFLLDSFDGTQHRRQWIKDFLIFLNSVFAIDMVSFSLMVNHMHLVLQTHPERVAKWSDLTVAERWAKLHPASIMKWGQALRPPGDVATLTLDQATRLVGADKERIAKLLPQLSCLSKYHQVMKQYIARRANLEDGYTGHLWNQRFQCRIILDEPSLLATMIYVDLNPIHAAVADTPENSDYTSIQDRITVRQWETGNNDSNEAVRGLMRNDEPCVWLASIERQSDSDGVLSMTTDEYIQSVDEMGRRIRPDKRGSISAALPPILQRLEQGGVVVVEVLRRLFGGFVGSVIGSRESCREEAARRGVRRVLGLRTTDFIAT